LFECAGDVDTFVPGDLQGSLNDIFIEREGGGGGGRVKQEEILDILGVMMTLV
jgi:hypothetical protein